MASSSEDQRGGVAWRVCPVPEVDASVLDDIDIDAIRREVHSGKDHFYEFLFFLFFFYFLGF